MNQLTLGIRTALTSFALLRQHIGLACLTLLPVLLFFNPLEGPLNFESIEFFGFAIPTNFIKSLIVALYSFIRNSWALGVTAYLFAIWAHTKISLSSLLRTVASRSQTLIAWAAIIGIVDFALGTLFNLGKESSITILFSIIQIVCIILWQLIDFTLIPRLADHKDSFLNNMRWILHTIYKRPLLIVASLLTLFLFAGLLYIPLIPQLLHKLIPKIEIDTLNFFLNLFISPWMITATTILAALTYRIIVPGPSVATHAGNWKLLTNTVIMLIAILIAATTITGLIALALAHAS